ncbi:MAG: PAS domain-containing sensor histidine kinase [Pseudomonadota bacterium]
MIDRLDTESTTWRVTPDLLGVLDEAGKFMQTNPAWQTVLGHSPEEIESQLFFEFVHPEDIARTAKAFVDIQHGRPILGFENRYRHKDGSYRWLSWNAVPEGDKFFCSARDVTQAKEDRAAVRAHEENERLREQFISVLGHDLRNPLAGAFCAVEFLQDREPLSDRAMMMLDNASESLQRMSRLIDDVLDFARARLGGDIGVEPQIGVPLRQVLERTAEEIRLAHPQVVLNEVYDFASPILCDPDRVAQLVSNLLANAITHGEAGGPVQIHTSEADGTVAIAVTNRGEEIPKDLAGKLFEPFERQTPETSDNGLGLGLFIAKQIAEGHRGAIEVTSSEGETTFTFRLPRGPRLIKGNDAAPLRQKLVG